MKSEDEKWEENCDEALEDETLDLKESEELADLENDMNKTSLNETKWNKTGKLKQRTKSKSCKESPFCRWYKCHIHEESCSDILQNLNSLL